MSAAAYQRIDPFAAQWLRNLIAAGHIAPGEVDERSIEDVTPDDLRGFTQCHFFAGIGVWSHSSASPDGLTIARSGLAPARASLSARRQGDGFADERHLWPHFFHLISERRPQHVFGEQVASGNANTWFDLVKQTWKDWDTPSGLCRLRQRASARRTSESGPTGWPTPQVNYITNATTVQMSSDGRKPEQNWMGGGIAGGLEVTPTSRDWKDSAGMTAAGGTGRNDWTSCRDRLTPAGP
jgi:DNA (cytosine-5)-methyltransferase 1